MRKKNSPNREKNKFMIDKQRRGKISLTLELLKIKIDSKNRERKLELCLNATLQDIQERIVSTASTESMKNS